MDSVKTKQDRLKWIYSKEYKDIKQIIASDISLTPYRKGLYRELAKKYNIPEHVVNAIGRKLGVSVYRDIELDRDAIIEDYNNGSPLHVLGEKYHHYEGDIKKFLLKNGVEWRRLGTLNKKHSWDNSYFKQIDSHEKAYWLGFIYADGNVKTRENNKGGLFQIALAKKDRYHVEKLKECLKSTHPICKDRGGIRFILPQKEIFEDLNRLGVHPRKSLTLEFPTVEQVPKEFINSFILGYFDGDGSFASNDSYQWSFQLLGTGNFIRKTQEEIINGTGLPKNLLTLEKRSSNQDLFYLVWGGGVKTKQEVSVNRLYNLYNFLYKDSNIFLRRKKEKFEELLIYCERITKI